MCIIFFLYFEKGKLFSIIICYKSFNLIVNNIYTYRNVLNYSLTYRGINASLSTEIITRQIA